MKSSTILLAIFIWSLFGCKVQQKEKANTSTIDLDELSLSNTIDYEVIKEWVGDKTIVSLGESSHGIGEFYSLKSEVVKYLHNDLGFEVLLMEAGMGDILLAWNDIGNLSASELREKTVYGNFSCTEVAPLFSYIKEKSQTENPLYYAGFDTQLSTRYYQSKIDSACRYLKLDIDVNEEFTYYSKIYQASFEPDSTNFISYRDRYLNTLSTIRKAVEDNGSRLQENMKWSALDYKIILRTLDMQYQSVDYNYANKLNGDNIHQALVLRDKFMAENVKWMVEELFPNKKIIIWGHNGHIHKGKVNNHQETKWMGQYLKDAYGDTYFSIGLFAYQGKAYHHWTGESMPFENSDSTSIEYKMRRDNFKYTFQKFGNRDVSNWVNEEVTAYEMESGIVYFTPSERFDAVICIDRVDIPTFDSKE